MTTTPLIPGLDYIGVGVGALILNDKNQVLLALRGPQARNEVGTWEIPGGKVEFGETLHQALKREVKEEHNIDIEILSLLDVYDHILEFENQHWVSPTYICKIVRGIPEVMEPGKCDRVDWFTIEEAKKLPLAVVTKQDIEQLEVKLSENQPTLLQ
jgi:mutator protein MutT